MVNFLRDYGDQVVTVLNPLASLPQAATEKKLHKQIEQKQRLIAAMKAKAQALATSDPEHAQQLNHYPASLTQRCVQLKELQQLEKVDGVCTRLGKMSLVSNVAIPGTGNILIALSIAGKSANVLYHALSSTMTPECLTTKAKSLGWDYAFNGTWIAAAYLLGK